MTTFYVIKAIKIVRPYTRTRKGKIEHVGGYTAEMTEAEKMKLERKREMAREWIRRHRDRMKSLKGEMDKIRERESEIEREEATIEKSKYIGVKEIRELEVKRAAEKVTITEVIEPSPFAEAEAPKVSSKEYYERVLGVKKDFWNSLIDSEGALKRLQEIGIKESDATDLLTKWRKDIATGETEKAPPDWMKKFVKETPEDSKRKAELDAEKKALGAKKKAIEEKAKVEAEESSFIRMGAAKEKKLAKEVLGAEKELTIGGSVGTVKGFEARMPGMEEFPEVESIGKVWIWKNEKTGFWDARNAESREWLVRSEDKKLTAEECYDLAYAKLKEVMGPRLAVAKERPVFEGLCVSSGEKFVDKTTGRFITVTLARAEGIEFTEDGKRKVLRPSEFGGRFERVPDVDTVRLDDKLKFGGLKPGDMLWSSMSQYGCVEEVGDTLKVLFIGDSEAKTIDERIWTERMSKVWTHKKAPAPPVRSATLTSEQVNALEYQGRGNEANDEHVKHIASYYGMSDAEVWKLVTAVKKIPLKVNRWFATSGRSFPDTFANCRLKNQFMLREHATSSGSLDPHKGGCRDGWERTMTGGALHRMKAYTVLASGAYLPEEVAELRPVYGHWEYSKGAAEGYGNIQLVMKEEVKDRAGYTIGNSSGLYHVKLVNRAGTFKNPMSLVEQFCKDYKAGKITKSQWTGILERGEVPERSSGDYIEAQIYGGVDLRRDVAKIIIRSGGYGRGRDTTGFAHIRSMAKKFGIPVELR